MISESKTKYCNLFESPTTPTTTNESKAPCKNNKWTEPRALCTNEKCAHSYVRIEIPYLGFSFDKEMNIKLIEPGHIVSSSSIQTDDKVVGINGVLVQDPPTFLAHLCLNAKSIETTDSVSPFNLLCPNKKFTIQVVRMSTCWDFQGLSKFCAKNSVLEFDFVVESYHQYRPAHLCSKCPQFKELFKRHYDFKNQPMLNLRFYSSISDNDSDDNKANATSNKQTYYETKVRDLHDVDLR